MSRKLILLIALMVTVSSGGVYSAGGRSITDSDSEVAGSEEVIDAETYEGEEAEEEKKESGRIEIDGHEWVRFLDPEENLIWEISLGQEIERKEPVGTDEERYNRILRRGGAIVSDNGKYVCVAEITSYDLMSGSMFISRERSETTITLYDNSGREMFQWKKDSELAGLFRVSDTGVVAVHVGLPEEDWMFGPVYVFSRTGEQLLKYPREGGGGQ